MQTFKIASRVSPTHLTQTFIEIIKLKCKYLTGFLVIYPDVLVAAFPKQRVRKTTAVLPPGLVDLQCHSSQPPGPLHQELLTHCFQVAHHHIQQTTIGHIIEQKVVDILLFYRRENSLSLRSGKKFISRQWWNHIFRYSMRHNYRINCI